MSGSPPTRITLEWPSDGRYVPVARLVVGGIAARADLAVDRVDELGMAMDELARHAPAADTMRMTVEQTGSRIGVAVGPFEVDPMASEQSRRVIHAFVDDCDIKHETDGFTVVLQLDAGLDGSG